MTATLSTQSASITRSDAARPPAYYPAWVRVIDAAMSGGVAAFALWTLIYEAGLGLRWPVTPLTLGWLILALPLAFVVGRATYRAELSPESLVTSSDTGTAASAQLPDPNPSTVSANTTNASAVRSVRHARFAAVVRLWPAALFAVAAAVLMAVGRGWLFWVGWAIALAALALVAVDIRRRAARPDGAAKYADGTGDPTSMGRTAGWHPVVVVLSALVVSVGSLFVFRPSPDDAYYINLSTWVATNDHFPLRDTMFSDEVFPTSYGGGFPISSIEGLVGALARLIGLSSATTAYFVVAPVLCFAVVWVLWQMARIWAPRRALAVFAMSALFVVIGRGNAYRAYSVFAIWQGKSAAIAVLLPLIWVYATRLAATRRAHWILMLGMVGTAFIGLTSTAALLAPAIGFALLLAAVILRNARLAIGAGSLVVAPLLGGAAVALLSRSVGGPHPKAPTPWQAIHHAYGSTATAMVILTLLAVLLGPFLVRSGQPRTLLWSAAAAVVLLLAPGVLGLGDLLTSAGPIEWRLLMVPPVPSLIGMLIVTTVALCARAARYRLLRVAMVAVTSAAAVIMLSLIDGAPPWQVGLQRSPTPVWKEKEPALRNVEQLIAHNPPRGRTVLMPPNAMIVLSMYTVQWHGVAPRPLYVASLQEPTQLSSARELLVRLASGRHPEPRPAVRHALQLLDVGTVCLSPGDHAGQASVRSAGFGPFMPIGTLRCSYRSSISG